MHEALTVEMRGLEDVAAAYAIERTRGAAIRASRE